MKANTFIIFLLFAFSCKDKSAKDKELKPTWEATIIMENKSQCKLDWEERSTTVNELFGIWEDTLSWVTNKGDSCWYGVRYLNRNITLELKPSKIFVKTYSFSDSTLNFVEKGEFFLNSKTAPSILTLALNPGKDTLFQHGDTMMSASYQIFWPTGNRLVLVGAVKSDNLRDYEILDFKKNNH